MTKLIVGLIGWIISMKLATGMTLALFYFMQSLISSNDRLDHHIKVIKLVDATMPEVDMVVIQEIDKPELVEELSEHQPELQDKHINLNEGLSLNIERATLQIDTGMDFSVASISTADGDYLPLVAIAPEYLTRAALRDIEGR